MIFITVAKCVTVWWLCWINVNVELSNESYSADDASVL